MKRILIFLFVIGAFIAPVYAQNMRDYVRRGNRLMLDTLGGSDYSEKAIVQYKKALDMDSTFSISRYNLGNALIRQSKPQEAMTEYLAAAKYETDKNRLSDIYHNMGVLLQSSKKYAEAVECYRVITGACEAGTRGFVQSLGESVKKHYTIAEMIEVTKGQ
jgi:tetratricopeptide (TPR) repeat protein